MEISVHKSIPGKPLLGRIILFRHQEVPDAVTQNGTCGQRVNFRHPAYTQSHRVGCGSTAVNTGIGRIQLVNPHVHQGGIRLDDMIHRIESQRIPPDGIVFAGNLERRIKTRIEDSLVEGAQIPCRIHVSRVTAS